MSETETEGLNKLDVDRAQSMADEGGASGAVVESEDAPVRRGRLGSRTALLFAATAAAGAGLMLICRRSRY
jgi:hypothetical protein